MPSASPIATIMFTMNRLSSNAWPTTAVTPSATTIEMIAISIGIATPTSVPTTSSSTISAAGQPELQLALAQVARRELGEVAIERVAAGDVRREPSAAVGALDERRSGPRSGRPRARRRRPAARWRAGRRTPGSRRPGPGSWRSASPLPLRRACADQRPHARGEGGSETTRALGAHDDDLVDRVRPGSRASMRSCAWSDSGWLVRLESEVRPEPSSVPIKPSDTSTTTPHTASTRPGRRVANSASRLGPSPNSEPRHGCCGSSERFGEEIDIPGS